MTSLLPAPLPWNQLVSQHRTCPAENRSQREKPRDSLNLKCIYPFIASRGLYLLSFFVLYGLVGSYSFREMFSVSECLQLQVFTENFTKPLCVASCTSGLLSEFVNLSLFSLSQLVPECVCFLLIFPENWFFVILILLFFYSFMSTLFTLLSVLFCYFFPKISKWNA